MERLKLLRMKKEVRDIEERVKMGSCADLEMNCRQADPLHAVLHRFRRVPRCTGKDALGQERQQHCLLLP